MFLFSALLFSIGFIFGIIAWFLLCPYKQKRNSVVKNEEERNTFESEVTESTSWINQILVNTYSRLKFKKRLIKVLQSMFDQQFHEDPKDTIQKIHVLKADISSTPPIFDQINTRSDDTVTSTEIKFDYQSEMDIDIDIDLLLYVVGKKTAGARLHVRRIAGCLEVKVPYKDGPVVIIMKRGTTLDFDVGARVGSIVDFGTDGVIEGIWTRLKSYIISMVEGMEFEMNIIPKEKKPAPPPKNTESEGIVSSTLKSVGGLFAKTEEVPVPSAESLESSSVSENRSVEETNLHHEASEQGGGLNISSYLNVSHVLEQAETLAKSLSVKETEDQITVHMSEAHTTETHETLDVSQGALIEENIPQ